MKRALRIGLVAGFALGAAGDALAGLPCAAYSSTSVVYLRVTGVGFPCSECDLVWCPASDLERMILRVTVRDCLQLPVPDCDLRLDLSGVFDPNDDLPATTNGRICGGASRLLTTDANGAVQFAIHGGGAGRYALRWVLTALCAFPEVELAARSDTLCIKSVDFNGSGGVNFQDTFLYAPELAALTGYSGDFRACSNANIVNFQDTFVLIPHLSAAHACPGGAGQSFLLTKPAGGIPPDCDVIF